MPYTANCDIFFAVQENAANLIALHVMRQRPSLFNYASQYVAQHPVLACVPVLRTADVDKYNPGNLFTVEPAIPVFGSASPAVSLNFSAQLQTAKIDFYPSNVITLPPAMNPPLAPQQFAMEAKLCAGLDCPSELLNQIPPGSVLYDPAVLAEPPKTITPPTRKLLCFCLDVFVVGHVSLESYGGQDWLIATVDQVNVDGLAPRGLQASVDCYLKTTANVILKERLAIPMDLLFLSIPLAKLATINISPSPDPPVPNDPAIQDNQLQAFADVQVV